MLARRTLISGIGLASLSAPSIARPARPEKHPVASAPLAAAPPPPVPPMPKSLGVDDRGTSLSTLCNTLAPLLPATPKGQFESSAEYVARVGALASANETPVGVTKLYKLNVPADRFRLSYDADDEKVVIGERWEKPEASTFLFSIVEYRFIRHLAVLKNWNPAQEAFERHALIESVSRRELPRRMNDSGFGPMVEVTPIRGSAVGLAYTHKSRSVAGSSRFSLLRTAAKSEFSQMRVLISGHVILPIVNEGFLHCEPTEMNTAEIHLDYKQIYMDVASLTFYSPNTGDVFHHMRFEQYT